MSVVAQRGSAESKGRSPGVRLRLVCPTEHGGLGKWVAPQETLRLRTRPPVSYSITSTTRLEVGSTNTGRSFTMV